MLRIFFFVAQISAVPFHYKFHLSERKEIDLSLLSTNHNEYNDQEKFETTFSQPPEGGQSLLTISYHQNLELNLMSNIGLENFDVYYKDFFLKISWVNQQDGVFIQFQYHVITRFESEKQMVYYNIPDNYCHRMYFYEDSVYFICTLGKQVFSAIETFSMRVIVCQFEKECRVYPFCFTAHAIISQIGFDLISPQISLRKSWLLKIPGNSFLFFQFNTRGVSNANRSIRALMFRIDKETNQVEVDPESATVEIPLIIYRVITVNENLIILLSKGSFYIVDRTYFLQNIDSGLQNSPTFFSRNEIFLSYFFDESDHTLHIFSRNNGNQIYRHTFYVEFLIERRSSILVSREDVDSIYYLELEGFIIKFIKKNHAYYSCIKIMNHVQNIPCHILKPISIDASDSSEESESLKEIVVLKAPHSNVYIFNHDAFLLNLKAVKPYFYIILKAKAVCSFSISFSYQKQIELKVDITDEAYVVWDTLELDTSNEKSSRRVSYVLKHLAGNLVVFPSEGDIRIHTQSVFKVNQHYDRKFSAFFIENPQINTKNLYVFSEDKYNMYQFDQDFNLKSNSTFPAAKQFRVIKTNFEKIVACLTDEKIELKFFSRSSDFSSTIDLIHAQCDFVHTVSYLEKTKIIFCFNRLQIKYYIKNFESSNFQGPFDPEFDGFTLDTQAKIVAIESSIEETSHLYVLIRKFPHDFSLYIIRLAFNHQNVLAMKVKRSLFLSHYFLRRPKFASVKVNDALMFKNRLVIIALDKQKNTIVFNFSIVHWFVLYLDYYFNLSLLLGRHITNIQLFHSAIYLDANKSRKGILYFTFIMKENLHLSAFYPDRTFFECMPLIIRLETETFRNFTIVPTFSNYPTASLTLAFATFANEDKINFEFITFYEKPIYLYSENPFSNAELTVFGSKREQQYQLFPFGVSDDKVKQDSSETFIFSEKFDKSIKMSYVIFVKDFDFNIYDIDIVPEYPIESYLGYIDLLPLIIYDEKQKYPLPEGFTNWGHEQILNELCLYNNNLLIVFDHVLNVMTVRITNHLMLLDSSVLVEIGIESIESKVFTDSTTNSFYKILILSNKILIFMFQIFEYHPKRTMEYVIQKQRNYSKQQQFNMKYNLFYYSTSNSKIVFHYLNKDGQFTEFSMAKTITYLNIYRLYLNKNCDTFFHIFLNRSSEEGLPGPKKDYCREEFGDHFEKNDYFLMVSFNEAKFSIEIDIVSISLTESKMNLVKSFVLAINIDKISEDFSVQTQFIQDSVNVSKKTLRVLLFTSNEAHFQLFTFRLDTMCRQILNDIAATMKIQDKIKRRRQRKAEIIDHESFFITRLSNPLINLQLTKSQVILSDSHVFMIFETESETHFFGFNIVNDIDRKVHAYFYANGDKKPFLKTIDYLFIESSRGSDEFVHFLYVTKDSQLGFFKTRKEITVKLMNSKAVSNYVDVLLSTERGVITSRITIEQTIRRGSLRKLSSQLGSILFFTFAFLFAFILLKRNFY